MRILTLTNLYPTDADPAFGTFVSDQVAMLRAHPRVSRCDVLFVDGRTSRWNYARGLAELHRALRRRPADVVHAHYGLTGALAVTQRRAPTVVTFHTGELEYIRWQRPIARWTYRLAGASICVSRHAMAELPGPAHYLPCGVDRRLFAPRDRAGARLRFGVPDGALATLFPSSPDRPKKLYGRFTATLEELRRRGHYVHELRLEGLTRDQVPEFMAAADVMILTSSQEGSPVAVMEALACGLPVVATPVGDVPDLLADARAAHVVPFDPSAFAGAVEEVVGLDGDRRSPDPSVERFDVETITERLVDILMDAASGGGAGQRDSGRSARRWPISCGGTRTSAVNPTDRASRE